MRISSVAIKGFRCFDAQGQIISLNNLTCMVGPNASGKSTSMLALVRIFGDSQADRTIRQSDFHLAPGEEFTALAQRQLSIEVQIELPEADDPFSDLVIPEVFNQMLVSQPGGTPFCRMRLSATWTADGTPFGEIQQQLHWITTPDNDPAVIENSLRPVRPVERARIRIVYVPATRDPSTQIRTSAATVFGRLLKAIDWGTNESVIQGRLDELRDAISDLEGLKTVNSLVQTSWSNLYSGRVATSVSFQSEQAEAASLLGLLVPSFSPDERGQPIQAADLSDGLRALFALSLPLGFYRIEERIKRQAREAGFKEDVAHDLPLLTVFAVEEPENHLSPHYLGKVLTELNAMSTDTSAQVLLSSHSPSIMRRVEPDNVRYCLGGEARANTKVFPLDLPQDNTEEEYKYVREAIRGYPELYFSRLVILGEGASEEIILRRVFEAHGNPLDSIFVSVVPLGGRHVNHFWRLLSALEIPHITLLDLDREKEGAGWGRLRYVRDQLLKLGGERVSNHQIPMEGGSTLFLRDVTDKMLGGADPHDFASMGKWVKHFTNNFDVVFCSPLDIDFSMLKSFPEVYKAQAPARGGPQLPSDPTQLQAELRRRMHQVLASDMSGDLTSVGISYNSTSEIPLFAWYKYLFQDGSKPVSHMRAMVTLETTTLLASLPPELRHVLNRALALVLPAASADRTTVVAGVEDDDL